MFRDNVIILCANCHKLIESHQFKKRYDEIIESEHLNEIKSYYETLKTNIDKFEFLEVNEAEFNNEKDKLLNVKDLEKLQNIEYGYGEAWMKYLVYIAKLTEQKRKVHTKDISESLGVTKRYVRKRLVNLIKNEFIAISGKNNGRYFLLSEKGFKALDNIKKIKMPSKN